MDIEIHIGIWKMLQNCRYLFLTLLIIFANIIVDSKILYVPVDWVGWLFIAACSNLTLQLLHQSTLIVLGGLPEVSYVNISIRLPLRQEQILKDHIFGLIYSLILIKPFYILQ